jgi:hypothetical protein
MKPFLAILLTLIATVSAAQNTSPEEIAYYKEAATSATITVISSADALKSFKASPHFNDIWTSAGALQKYEDYVTSYSAMLKTVHDGLLSTATHLLEISQYEIQAAKQGLKYRNVGY